MLKFWFFLPFYLSATLGYSIPDLPPNADPTHLGPIFSHQPEDVSVDLDKDVLLLCQADGDPQPSITWEKFENGWMSLIPSNRSEVLTNGSLQLNTAREEDEAYYRCLAVTDHFEVKSSIAFLEVNTPQQRMRGRLDQDLSRVNSFVEICSDDARSSVRKAYTMTHKRLFGDKSYAMSRYRYPPQHLRGLALAGETHYRALDIVYASKESRQYSFDKMLNEDNMHSIEDETGCKDFRRSISCEDVCFNKRFRTFDGSCNNLKHPVWGSASFFYRRLLDPHYADGYGTPVGANPSFASNGFYLPNARTVSHKLLCSTSLKQDPGLTLLLMQWGQFVDHDLDLALASTSKVSYSTGEACDKTCDYSPPCFGIKVDDSDIKVKSQCIPFIRNSAACNSETKTAYLHVHARDQINSLNSYLDLSQVYGSDDHLANLLYNHETGRMIVETDKCKNPEIGELLPTHIDQLEQECIRRTGSNLDCFVAGDPRANENLGLMGLHILLVREHNRIVDKLKKLNPMWDGERLYQEARKIAGAIFQRLTFYIWLPLVLGEKFDTLVGWEYRGYDENVDATISNEFATAAFRFGHGTVNSKVFLHHSYDDEHPEMFSFNDVTFNPDMLCSKGLDSITRGILRTPAKLQNSGDPVSHVLCRALFEIDDRPPVDLSSLNIQRGRDHGLAPYIHYVHHCGNKHIKSFRDLLKLISNVEKINELEKLYGSIYNVDLFAGGILEDPVPQGRVGPTFACIIAEVFKNLRAGDRFWFENPGVFTPEQLGEIEKASFEKLFCNTGDNLQTIPHEVFQFIPADEFDIEDDIQSCDDVEDYCLDPWIDPDAALIPLTVICGSSDSDGKELTVIADGVTLITETSSSGTGVGTKVEISRNVDVLVLNCAGTAPSEVIVAAYSEVVGTSSVWKCHQGPLEEAWLEADFDNSMWDNGVELVPSMVDGQFSSAIKLPSENNLVCRWTSAPIIEEALFEATCTDEIEVYVDGVKTAIPFENYAMYIGQVLLSSRPFLVAISCFHPLFQGDAQARNTIGVTPGILVRSGYGLNTGAENWKCIGLDREQSDDDWAQFNFDDSDWFDPVIRADAGVSLVNQDQDPNNVWIWGRPESGEDIVPQYTLCRLFVSSLEGESCLNYKRSLPICNDDGTPGKNYREQENFNTGYLDGSAIYGSTLKASHNLRLFEGGLLKHAPGGMCSDFLPREKYLYFAGDSRVTSFPHLLAVHTLFLREHNRIAREIQRLTRYPDEKIYELARKLTIAELQSITLLDLLPMILGRTPEFMKQYTKYNPTVNAGVEQAIAAAVSGFIYTVIPPEVITGGVDTSQYSSRRSGNLIDYFAGTKQYDYTCAPDQLLSGLMMQSPLVVNTEVAEVLQKRLFDKQEDLFARLIQIGRDHGLPGYNTFRQFCGLQPKAIGDAPLDNPVFQAYVHSDLVELYPAMLLEAPVEGGSVGETMRCLLEHQFQKTVEGDRFFISHSMKSGDPVFTTSQREQLYSRRIRDLICDNTDITKLQPNPFTTEEDKKKFKDCETGHALKVHEFINIQDLIRPIPPQLTNPPSPYSGQPSPSSSFISYNSPNNLYKGPYRADTSPYRADTSSYRADTSPYHPDTSPYRQVQYGDPRGSYSGPFSQHQGPATPYTSPGSVFQSFPWTKYDPYLQDRVVEDGYGQNSVRPFGPANIRGY